ncbi:SIMPL domain-containing protein [Paenibacillus sp. JX-17]|uniref:SIMPL domain-containing protein n=1 Tax=Paenibacillus lacisoli TaxID=3064525 RepID=A0ABT9CLN4_9BACL|nr:SIMPL domain-containing protein [Paenibacillus sp. JX-17]MDO7908518.1 SIMPL domain-containing protein [Paenibacillus sp. JX-17]
MNRMSRMAGTILVAGTLLVGGTGVSALLGGTPAYAAELQDVQRNVISVSGKGELKVKPDIAYLSIGVQAQAETAASAQKAVAAKMAKINDALKNTWKISGDDIRTDQFYVQPNYTYNEKEGQKLKSYTAYHSLSVNYRDLTKVGQLLDAVSAAGANSIGNVKFSVENPDQYEEQVIAKAMANADMKAGAIAKAAKRQLGIVLNVDMGSAAVPITMSEANMKMSYDTASSAGSATQAQPGQVIISTLLNVQYEMK